MRIPIAASSNGLTTDIPFELEFTERKFTYVYYTISDIFTYIGGIYAALMPIMGLIAPLYVWLFLNMLASILKEKSQKAYKAELYDFLKYCNELLKKYECKDKKLVVLVEKNLIL
jgi:hypothetical protein